MNWTKKDKWEQWLNYSYALYALEYKIGNLEQAQKIVNYFKSGTTFNFNDNKVEDNEVEIEKACINGDLKTVKKLLKNKDDASLINECLLRASENGHFEIVKFLVEEKGGDVNTEELLTEACNYGHFKIVKFLIENGADIHTNDEEAFIKAVRHGHLKIAELLLQNGADIHAGENEALLRASEDEDFKTVLFLLSRMKNSSKYYELLSDEFIEKIQTIVNERVESIRNIFGSENLLTSDIENYILTEYLSNDFALEDALANDLQEEEDEKEEN